VLLPKKLMPDRSRENFRKQRWNSIANLPVHGRVPTCNDDVVRESLQPAELSH